MLEWARSASVIVVVYNNVEYIRMCLESIYRNTTGLSFEVVVVDNGSGDATPELLAQFARHHANLVIVRHEQNEGFPRACNAGVGQSRGDVIVLLNDDTVVTEGWLAGLGRHLKDRHVGLVGPVTNWSGNESRIDVSYKAIDGLDEFAEAYASSHSGEVREMRMLAFFCVALRREVWDNVGPLDERFGIGMFEDDDYAERVRRAGYRIVCAEDVFVHHWGRASFSKLEHARYQELFDENKDKFEAKWGMKWKPPRFRRSLSKRLW